MASAALHQLETLLHARKLGATLTDGWTSRRETSPSGIATLDTHLGGGWPCGAVSEIVGGHSTGRTAVLVASLAQATARGAVVALVDTLDRFDPVAAERAGLHLDRVLWVRGPSFTAELSRPAVLERAVHQAVRAFDLILRAGGFAVVALDLGDIPARCIRTLPPTTWLRLAHVNEGRPTAALLVEQAPGGRSARGLSVPLDATTIWTGDSLQSRRFAGFAINFGTPSTRTPSPVA
ncbi:MAG: hypothetical protein ABI051_11115 [Vicinamibacterales bacterium]